MRSPIPYTPPKSWEKELCELLPAVCKPHARRVSVCKPPCGMHTMSLWFAYKTGAFLKYRRVVCRLRCFLCNPHPFVTHHCNIDSDLFSWTPCHHEWPSVFCWHPRRFYCSWTSAFTGRRSCRWSRCQHRHHHPNEQLGSVEDSARCHKECHHNRCSNGHMGMERTYTACCINYIGREIMKHIGTIMTMIFMIKY